jgi:hypothetical protein
MNSKQVNLFVNDLIGWFGTSDDQHVVTLDAYKIPETELNELAALIMSQDDMLASEATGPDNPEWEKAMLPALYRSMNISNTNPSPCFAEEFHDVWTSGVRAYLMPYIEEMINNQLEVLNEDMGCHTSLIWDRASERTVEIRSHT